jgi:hypothetical protein
MARFTRYICIAVLSVTFLGLGSSVAFADRSGGPISGTGTVAAGRTAHFNVIFEEGAPAIVTISGNGSAPLELIIRDALGNVVRGVGTSDSKTATMNVYRTGNFRIEVRNTGSYTNNFRISTN